MTDFFELGRVLKPQGVRGEIKAELYTDDPSRIADLAFVFFMNENEAYEKIAVESARTDGRFGYLKFAGVNDRDEAEKLRDRIFFIDRANAAPLEEGSYYISDLIGLEVRDDEGAGLGRVRDVMQTGAADIYVVEQENGGTLMFPSLPDLFVSRDPEQGLIVVSGERLKEVASFDDV